MNEPLFDDEELLSDLQSAGQLDPVPPEALAAARAVFMWRTIDGELAELTYDSLLDTQRLADVRGTGAPRLLTFEAPSMTLELEASVVGERRRLIGQLVPPQRGRIEIRHGGGPTTVEADALGRFETGDLMPGPVSLVCRTGHEATVSTDWVLV
jgi:hypothetical protein